MEEVRTLAKFVEFVLQERKPKTNVWVIKPKDSESILGYVRWYGAWRCYVFEPCPETLYEKQCLRDIADFLDAETQKLRAQWKAQKK